MSRRHHVEVVMDPKRQLLATWYGACAPDRILSAEEMKRLYVKLDSFVDGKGKPHALRGPPVADILMDHILLPSSLIDGRSTQLFSGFRGTGKTTELERLAVQLRAAREFVVIRMDAQDYFNSSEVPTAEEMALILAAGIGEAARGAPELENVAQGSVWVKIWTEIENLQVELNVEGKVSWGPVELQALLKQRHPSLRKKLKQLLGDRPVRLKSFLHGQVLELVRALPGPQLVIMVDGLEKFSGPEGKVVETYTSLCSLFVEQRDLLCLPGCHVVYTVPPYIGFLNQGLGQIYGELRLLPSVKIAERPSSEGANRRAFKPGLDALMAILACRIDLVQLFGPHQDLCARKLAAASGGHVRDLLMLAREVIGEALRRPLPLNAKLVDEVIRRVGFARANPLWADVGALLGHVKRTSGLEGLDAEQLDPLYRSLNDYLVLSYYNGQPWYDVHPLVRDRVH